ncbi:expressed unknown protein [Seminavis robusta]|uniref:Uncharacterized protein n=1 Tax=Seminavis robusta TaxID=568900 RepID=A0A9N8HQA8_9STRA|nr:expressed unknown protein [Seminavis robusta]|eukprot:Sro1149_g246530.1 n/a (257) ;mRNA; r:4503-5273
MMISGRLLPLLILQLLLPKGTLSLSININSNPIGRRDTSIERRETFSVFWKALGVVAIPTATAASVKVDPASAACLPGDVSPECIGVYKIPLQDALSSPLLNTPEALKKNAPDINYVKPVEGPPKSVMAAKEVLLAQRTAADDIRQVIQQGRLQEAGIKVLNLIPKITGAGITIQQQVQSQYPESESGTNRIRVLKFENELQELIASWNSIDIEIGQALRGQMGVSAVAQIQLLSSLKDATAAFDDFLLVVDANIK